MIRDFNQAWADLEIGEMIRVSDGTKEPLLTDPPTPMWLGWATNNFEATLVEKHGDAPARRMDFEIETPNGSRIVHIAEDHPVSFTFCRCELTAADWLEVKRGEINAKLAEVVSRFVIPDGPMAGEALQIRNADDKANWDLSRTTYKEMVDAGLGEAEGAFFRTESNATFGLTFAEGLRLLDLMRGFGFDCMARSWALKDAAKAAVAAGGGKSELDAIDIATGWPGQSEGEVE